MVDFLIGLAGHLDAVLVQRVVIGATHVQRVPGVAARYLAGESDALGLQAISLLLLLVFLAQGLRFASTLPMTWSPRWGFLLTVV